MQRVVKERRWSQIVHVALEYSPEVLPDAPRALVVKVCAGDRCVFSDSELRYYTEDYVGYAAAPLVRCYHAERHPAGGGYCLVLEDLSATHAGDAPVSLPYGQALGSAAARLHAPHWGAEALARAGFAPPGEEELRRFVSHVQRGYAPLRDVLGADLPAPWHRALERMNAPLHGAMAARARRPEGMTLVHGDLNPGNVLAPVRWPGEVFLLDRQPFDWSLTRWLGVSDLAYAMVLFWQPGERRALQEPVLRHYQRTLGELGVEYAWERVLADYRWGVAGCVWQAVEWLVEPGDRTPMRWLWEPQLERSMAAYFELGCEAALFGR